MSAIAGTVGLIHAVIPAMAPMRETLARRLPEVRVLNLLDEGLLSEAERYGATDPRAVARLRTQIELLLRAGSDAVLLTCTAYSPAVPEMRRRFAGTPILAVDQAMVERAVASSPRIGVVATNPTGLSQQRTMLREAARAAGKEIEIVESLHPEAMEALGRGDRETHDRIVLDALGPLAERAPLILLAQVSMSHLAERVPRSLAGRVLSSPALAAEELARILAERRHAST